MGKTYNPEEVEMPGSLLPDGMYTMKVVEMEETETSPATHNKYMLTVRARVVAPAKFKNRPVSINFVIGTDEDPGVDDDATWGKSFAMKRFKSLLVATETPETGDIDEYIESFGENHPRFVVDCGHSDDKKYQEFRAFFKEGEQEDADEAPVAPSAKKKAPVAEEEGEDEDEAPAPKKAAKGKPAKKAAKDEDWD